MGDTLQLSLTHAEEEEAASHRTDIHGHVSNMATYQTNNGPQHFVNNYFGAAPSSDQRPETEFDLPFDVVQPLFRPQFVGRESEVSRIHEALQVAGRVQVIIHGLGGVGKTRLALEYAMRYYKAYSAVLWIDARDSSALQSSYTEIMRKLRQHYRGTGTEWSDNDSPSIVKEWLGRSANDKWILICDNLDEIKTAVRNDGLELERIFPGGLHGKIIITTRSTSLQGDCDINLGKLAQIKESLELLMHTSRRGDGVLIDPEAKLLAEDLDGLPLALCTAGKYLTQEVTTFGEYRQHHRESWRRLDSITGELLTSAETTVGSVCDIALEKLSRRNPMASKVLAFWGYFDNGDIWYELLKPTTSTSLSWLTATMRDTLSFNQTMRQLCDSGLVDTAVVLSGSSTSKGYKIHSCMHAWVKAVLLPTLETDALSTALQLMATQILPETAQNFWLHDRRILPHVRHVWPMMEQQSVSCNPMILVRMGELHQRNRNLETASALYEQAIKNFMATSTGDDKKALDAFRSLVTILIEQEQPARAVGLLDDLRSRLVDAFGERDRSTLHVLQALGWAYAESGNNDLAEAVLDYIVNIYGVEYGRMHLYTLGARNNLANLYQLKGDFAVAEQTFTEILGAMQATAGPEHPQTIGVLHNLGRLYRMQGFFANAETIYRRERDEYLRIYGKHSFKTIVATGCIGLVFRQQGRYQEAHEILQGALSTAQETQGIDNKAFNFILRLIGDVYRDQAKPEHASRYYRQAAKYANAAVSEGHPTMGATDQIYCDDEIEVYLSTVDEPSLETAAVDYHFSGPTMQVADCVSTPESEEVVDQIRARPKGDMSYRPLPPSPDPIKPLASTCSQPIAASVDLPRGQDANALSRITSLHNVFESDLIHVDDKDKEQVVAGCKDGTSIKSNFVESISNQAHWSQIGLQLGDYVHQGPFTFGPVHSPEDPKHADAIDARAPVQQEKDSMSEGWIHQVKRSYEVAFRAPHRYVAGANCPRVRIAVLDTGYDATIDFHSLHRKRRSRIQGWRDFAESRETPCDTHGHGSHILSTVMSLAPFADIFVARVARHSDDLEHASTAITRAIQWASEEHQVDIINMSLKSDGDTANQPSLREAIRAVVHRRDDRILFFGAAGNAGANEPGIAFPACHENVIPIFGTTPNGRFDDDLNPRIDPDGPAIFGTLGFDVPCHGVENGGEVEYRSGTSFSCANAAGFAATLLQYVQVLQHSKQDEQGANSLDWFNRLKTKRGMTSLFREISDRTPDRKYYLWPVRFFGRPASDSEADIIRALRYR